MNTNLLRPFFYLAIIAFILSACQTDESVSEAPAFLIPVPEEAKVSFEEFIAPEAWQTPGKAIEASLVPGRFARVNYEQGVLLVRLIDQGMELIFSPYGQKEAYKAPFFPEAMNSYDEDEIVVLLPDEEGAITLELAGQICIFGSTEGFFLWQVSDDQLQVMTEQPRFFGQRTIWPLWEGQQEEHFYGLGSLVGGFDRAGGQYHLWPEHQGQTLASRFIRQTGDRLEHWEILPGVQTYYDFGGDRPWLGQLSGPLHFKLSLGEAGGGIPVSWKGTLKAHAGDQRLIPLWMLGHHRVFGGDAPQVTFLDRVQEYRNLRAPLDGVIYSPGTGFREGMIPTSEVGFVHKVLGQNSTKPMIWLNEETWKETETWRNADMDPGEYLSPYNQWLGRDAWGFFWYAENRAPEKERWGEEVAGLPFRQALRDLGNRRKHSLSENQNTFLGGSQRPVIALEESSNRAEVLHRALNQSLSFGANPAVWVRGHSYDSQSQWLRNMEFALFMPFFLSEGDLEQEALFRLDTPFYRRWTALIKERYKLIPYYFQSLVEARRNGIPLLRPLFWDFGSDPETWTIEDQFMIGKDLMIAPILEDGTEIRRIYLPRGEKWFVWRSGEELPSGRWLEVRIPPGQPLIIARGGTVIPSGFPGQIAEETKRFLEEYHYFPGQTAKLSRYWAFIDGQVLEDTDKIVTEMTASMNPREIRLVHEKISGAPPRVPAALIRFRRVRKPRRVLFDGFPIDINGPSYGVTESDVVTSWYEEDGSLLVKVFRPNAGFELVLEY
jgi:hypothetical protein